METPQLEYAAAKGVVSGRKPLWHYGATLGAMASCLLAARWIAAHAMDWHRFLPSGIVDWLFFLPQAAFPYRYVAGSGAGESFLRSNAGVFSAIQWVNVSTGLLWMTKRVRLGYVLAMVPVVIVAVAHAVPMVLDLFGVGLSFGGL